MERKRKSDMKYAGPMCHTGWNGQEIALITQHSASVRVQQLT
jgi:hypothetical protein